MRERSFRAFLEGGGAPAVSALEVDILSLTELRPLHWPQLPSLRQLIVRCSLLQPFLLPAMRLAMRCERVCMQTLVMLRTAHRVACVRAVVHLTFSVAIVCNMSMSIV